MRAQSLKTGRWTWLTLSVLVSAVAIAALFALHAREQEARAKEQVARSYAARLEQSIDELTPIGQYLLEHDPAAFKKMLQRGLGLSGDRLRAVAAIDPVRAAEIAATIDKVKDQINAGRPDGQAMALVYIARGEDLANEVADRERRRAEAAEQQALIGGVAALVLALLLVVALTRGERHASLREARLHANEIQYLADHDSLTGLPNRRRFDADLDGLTIGDGAIEIAVCDLNNFKEINDRLGHHAGDSVLIAAARDLEAEVGHAGTVYRTGGDEFCVVSSPSRHVGDAVRRAFEREEDPTIGSVGLATWPSDHLSPRSVVRLADKRMYEVKRAIEGSSARDRRREPR